MWCRIRYRTKLTRLPLTVLLFTCLHFMNTVVVQRVPTPEVCQSPMPAAAELDPPTPPSDFIISATANYEWIVNGPMQPSLTLTRGSTYMFDLAAFSDEHAFLINDQFHNPSARCSSPDAMAVWSASPRP